MRRFNGQQLKRARAPALALFAPEKENIRRLTEDFKRDSRPVDAGAAGHLGKKRVELSGSTAAGEAHVVIPARARVITGQGDEFVSGAAAQLRALLINNQLPHDAP